MSRSRVYTYLQKKNKVLADKISNLDNYDAMLIVCKHVGIEPFDATDSVALGEDIMMFHLMKRYE